MATDNLARRSHAQSVMGAVSKVVPPHPGRWWVPHDGRFRCELCPRLCLLAPGQRGFCFVREAGVHGIVLSTYGRSSGFCIDPIEKKPLFHFHPGSAVLSFGTAGLRRDADP